jgi:hypothetical protein
MSCITKQAPEASAKPQRSLRLGSGNLPSLKSLHCEINIFKGRKDHLQECHAEFIVAREAKRYGNIVYGKSR